MQPLDSGVTALMRREVVEDGAVCLASWIAMETAVSGWMGNGVQIQRLWRQRISSDFSVLWSSLCSFFRFFPPFPSPPTSSGFHIPDPKLSLLASRALQQVSSADYEHGGCRPSREVTSLGGMLHVRHVRGGRKGAPGEAKPTNMEQHLPVNPASVKYAGVSHTSVVSLLVFVCHMIRHMRK